MGYSSRYHAASLAAVFVALAVGILIGAALGSDVIEGTAKDLEDSLSEDLDETRAALADAEEDLAAEQELGRRLYPAVVDGRLRNRRIALISLGELDPALRDAIAGALGPSGAELAEVAAVRLPPETNPLIDSLRNSERRRIPRGEALNQAARRAGRLLAGRGDALSRARDALLTLYQGTPDGVDGVIVARSVPGDLQPRLEADTVALQDGILEGLESTGVPVVGVETEGADPSSIEFFDERIPASVDSVDTLAGQVALVLALDGAEGDFGVKETADSLLPELLTEPAG